MSDTSPPPASDSDEPSEAAPKGSAAVIVQGLLPVVKEAKSRLANHDIPSVVVPAPADAAKDPRGALFLLAIDPKAVDAAQAILVGDVTAPVIDFNAAEMTCPACTHTFETGPKECPDCGLFLG